MNQVPKATLTVTPADESPQGKTKKLDRSYETPTPAPGTAHIKLGHGRWAVVDVDQFERLSDRPWRLQGGYAVTMVKKNGKWTSLFMHCAVLPVSGSVDHIDLDKLNNRKSNLRPSTQSQQRMNIPARQGSKTGLKGVRLNPDGTFHALVTYQGVRHYLGRFATASLAAKAYDEKALNLVGEFARLNCPVLDATVPRVGSGVSAQGRMEDPQGRKGHVPLDRSYETPPPDPGTLHLKLGHGRYAVIDKHQLPRVDRFTWYGSGGYAHTHGAGHKTIKLHSLVLPGHPEVDHVNGVRFDCRVSNLRPCTTSQNQANRGPARNNTSGYKGVSRASRSLKWQATIIMNKQSFHLGTFLTPEEAARAYDTKALSLFGPFAYLNFPEGVIR